MEHTPIGYTNPSKRRVAGGVVRRTKRWHKMFQIGGSLLVMGVVVFIVLHSTSLHPTSTPPTTSTTSTDTPSSPPHPEGNGNPQHGAAGGGSRNKHPYSPRAAISGGTKGVPVASTLTPLAARLAGIQDLQISDHERLRTIEDILTDMEPVKGGVEADGGELGINNKRKFGDRLEKLQVEHVSHDAPLSIYSRVLEPCDPASAPFDNNTAQAICTEFMGIVISSAMAGLEGSDGGLHDHRDRFVVTLKASLPYRWRFRRSDIGTGAGEDDDLYDRTFVVHFRPLYPQFEQRTVKYSATISTLDVADWEVEREAEGDDGEEEGDAPSSKKKRKGGRHVVMGEGGEKLRGGQIGVIIKVPQSLFPREPFSEVMAYHLDRKLGIHRVPPTSLVFLPAAFIVNISRHRQMVNVPMDDMLLRESGVKDYDSWIDNDYGNFILRSAGGNGNRRVGNGTHNWASIQLRLLEVRPSLDTMLQLPYSKKNPGWHRWLSPDFKDIELTEPAVLALSQLAMFDFITANDDRSPNKNSFVVGGCKACAGHLRRPSGLHPTFVHLDQGMSLFENVPLLSHNPIGKTPKKVKFCIFYKPLIRAIRDVLLHHGDGGEKGGFAASPIEGSDTSSTSVVEWIETQVPKSVLSNIGSGSIGKTLGKRMWGLVKRLVHCIDEYAANGTSVILRP